MRTWNQRSNAYIKTQRRLGLMKRFSRLVLISHSGVGVRSRDCRLRNSILRLKGEPVEQRRRAPATAPGQVGPLPVGQRSCRPAAANFDCSRPAPSAKGYHAILELHSKWYYLFSNWIPCNKCLICLFVKRKFVCKSVETFITFLIQKKK